MTEKTIYERAVRKWGVKTQTMMAIEELSELIQVLAKYDRNINGSTVAQIAEEVADVELMLEQIKVMFDLHVTVEMVKESKLKRLEGYLNA